MAKSAKMKIGIAIAIIAIAVIVGVVVWTGNGQPSSGTEKTDLKVGYLSITPNLPFYVALEKGLFKKRGLNVEAVPLKTSNAVAEALITKRVDFTTVVALSVLQSLEVASPGRLKIYQINYIPKSDPNDYLIVKKGPPIKKIEDLKGKKIALFPGSNFNVWAKLIFGDHFGFGKDMETISMPPPLHVQGLAAGSVDAIYCLEPTATIALAKGIGEVLDVGLVCKYIFDPFPVTGNAVLSEFVEKNPKTTKAFCEAMYEAMQIVHDDPGVHRQYLTKYCKIPEGIAAKVKLGHGKPSKEIDVDVLQKTVDLYMKEGLLTKSVDMRKMLLYPPGDN
jgi:NitT/TauT family transport system substrate-binding protein